MSSNIVIIKAHGSSERIIKKNMKDLNGQSIINYVLKVCYFNKVIKVCTNSEGIMAMALKPNILFRRSVAISSDNTIENVLYEVVVQYDAMYSYCEVIAYIYLTVTFVTAQKFKVNKYSLLIVKDLGIRDVYSQFDWKTADIKYKLLLEKTNEKCKMYLIGEDPRKIVILQQRYYYFLEKVVIA